MILFPAAVMIGVAEGSPMQLGIRYVLPAIPFFILFAIAVGPLARLQSIFPIRTLTTVVLAAGMLLSCAVPSQPPGVFQ
jgi:hypothetical protein